MGTKVQFESLFPGYFSMRDLNEDSNSCSWPLYYGDRTLSNGQYYNGFLPRPITDVYSGYDKDVVKRTMLEHEAIFKNQLCELHRLYRIQRDLMDEAKMKELYKNWMPVETSLSSSPLASQITSEDARKWCIPSFTLGNSVCAIPSISGSEDLHSPLSSMKGSSVQASPFLTQNGGTSKDVEILEFRPTKVKRRMFDLQLPADEYIDTEVGEQLRDENGNSVQNNCQGDALQTESSLKTQKNLADLNELLEVEDTNTSANDSLHCTSHSSGFQEHPLVAKPNSQFLGFPQGVLLKSHKDSKDGVINDLHLQNNANGKLWFPHMLDSGHNKNNLKSVSQAIRLEKLPSSSQQSLLNKSNESATPFLTDQGKVDQLRETTVHGSELSEIKKDSLNNNYPVTVVASSIPSRYGFEQPSDMGKSWSQSISSWEKLTSSLHQNSTSVQMHPYLNSSATLSSSQSTQSHGFSGDRWNYINSVSNLRTKSDPLHQNGFYHGSSSGSKELLIQFPSCSCDNLKCSSASNAVPEHFINNNSSKLHKSSNCRHLKFAKEVNLNVTRVASQQTPEIIDLEREYDDNAVALPWLRAKPNSKNESTYAGVDLNLSPDKIEAGKVPNQVDFHNINSVFCSNGAEASRIEMSDSSSCKKILGFPIFEKPKVSKIEPSSLTSPISPLPQPSSEVENNRKNRILDINLPCDQIPGCGVEAAAEVLFVEKETETQDPNVRHQIDLNSCVTEDEACLPALVTSSNVKKIISGIDLEAPPGPENEDVMIRVDECVPQQKADSPPDEYMRTAAEAIVAISLSVDQNHQDDATCHPVTPGASMTDPLHWFVEIVSFLGEDLEKKYVREDCEDNEDYFESMTLRLPEMKEEDYMPKPLVPENLILEESGTTLLSTRTRKGHTRRGRQRRDFQRDILPGLTSLSRHEVTEDLQTFGGLMRAMGHIWQSGLTRRNGFGRGRRRAVISASAAVTASPPPPLIEQLNNVEVGVEDRSLTGWGQTTRRPRRQRCPPGNPAALHLS